MMNLRLYLPIFSILFIILSSAVTASAGNTYDMHLNAVETTPSGGPGSLISIWYDLTNHGPSSSMSDHLIFYLSPDKNISGSDYQIGETTISFLQPGAETNGTLMGTVPASIQPGTYYAGGALESDFSLLKDTNLSNNYLAGNRVSINSSYQRPQQWINEKIADLIFTYSNDERKKRGIPELKRDKALDLIATENSENMAELDYFDHINPAGEAPPDRAARHGYNQTKTTSDGSLFYGIGENIVKIPIGTVQEFGSINPDNPEQLAKVAVESFIESPPHKMSLLLRDYDVIGVGVAFDGKQYYATQNFF